MRMTAIVCGYVVAIAIIAGLAARAINNVYALSAKQTQELTAELDRIVAQGQEKRRELAEETKEQPALTAAKDATAGNEKASATGKDDQPAGAKAVPAAKEAAKTAVKEAAVKEASKESAKPARKRYARARPRGERMMPVGFLTLPKFTPQTFFGLR